MCRTGKNKLARHPSTAGLVTLVKAKKSQPQMQPFYATFFTMSAINSAEDLTTVPIAHRGQQLENCILTVGMELWSLLANDEDDLEEVVISCQQDDQDLSIPR